MNVSCFRKEQKIVWKYAIFKAACELDVSKMGVQSSDKNDVDYYDKMVPLLLPIAYHETKIRNSCESVSE